MSVRPSEYYSRSSMPQGVPQQRCRRCGRLIMEGPEAVWVCPQCGGGGLEAYRGESPSGWTGAGGERAAEDLEALGRARFAAGRMEEAEGYFRQAAEIFQELGKMRPAEYMPRAAKMMQFLGGTRVKSGRVREGLVDLREAVRIYMRLEDPRFTPDLVAAMDILGSVCVQTVGGDEAEPIFRSMLPLVAGLAQQDPQRYGEKHADALDKLAGIHLTARRWEEAESHYVQSMEMRKRLRSGWNPEFEANVARQGMGLSVARGMLGKNAAAAEAAQEALEIYEMLSQASPGIYDEELAKCREYVQELAKSRELIDNTGMKEVARSVRKPSFWDRLRGRG